MINEQLDVYRKDINQTLQRIVKEQEVIDLRYQEALLYAIGGGKYMRPCFTYIIGTMFNIPYHAIKSIACAIEFIHTFSLVHDDLPSMDDDNLRRGKLTVHKKYGENIAILIGDSLHALAFDTLANIQIDDKTQVLTMLSQLAKASGCVGMCAGQYLDVTTTGKNISLEQLQTIHRLKTSVLIECSITFPYILSTDKKQTTLNHLQKIAQLIGLAFQIQNDIADLTLDRKTLGKEPKKDVKLHKNTYPLLLGLDSAESTLKNMLNEITLLINTLTDNTSMLNNYVQYLFNMVRKTSYV